MSNYPKVKAREWVQPTPRGYKFQCCDCGLVHRLDFRQMLGDREFATNLRIQFRAYRDNRATAAVRREARKKGVLLVER